MNKNIQEAYAEVDEILNLIEEKYVRKIPDKIINLIKKGKSNDYQPKIDTNIPLKDQNISREALVILAVLNLNYWCENEKEKQKLLKIYSEIDEINREKFSINNLFNNKDNEIKKVQKENNNLEMNIYKENLFKKLVNKIKRMLKIVQ